MKLFKYLFAFCSIFLFTSCLVRTIYPLFEDNEIVFEPKLIGKWMNNDSSEIWEFSKYKPDDTTRNPNKYRLQTIAINKDAALFEALTGMLGKNLFLDVTIDNREMIKQCSLNLRQSSHLIFTHIFYKVNFKDDSLCFVEMSKEWYTKNMKKLKISILPRDEGDYVTLTSRTKQLQNFIKKYANNPKAFPESGYLHRID